MENKTAYNYLTTFISSIGAGIMISCGGFVFIVARQTSIIVASFLFSIGLLSVIALKLWLFTGKVGYIFENKPDYLVSLFVCWFGNFLGAVLCGLLLKLVRVDYTYLAETIVSIKTEDSPLSIFVLSIFCGMMIFLAVELQRKDIPSVFKLLGIILPVMVFIVCGFEHCVANMFYFTYAGRWSLHNFWYIIIMSVGNGTGSLLLWLIFNFGSKYFVKDTTTENK